MLGVKLAVDWFGDKDGWEESLMEFVLCGLEIEASLEEEEVVVVVEGLRPMLLVLL